MFTAPPTAVRWTSTSAAAAALLRAMWATVRGPDPDPGAWDDTCRWRVTAAGVELLELPTAGVAALRVRAGPPALHVRGLEPGAAWEFQVTWTAWQQLWDAAVQAPALVEMWVTPGTLHLHIQGGGPAGVHLHRWVPLAPVNPEVGRPPWHVLDPEAASDHGTLDAAMWNAAWTYVAADPHVTMGVDEAGVTVTGATTAVGVPWQPPSRAGPRTPAHASVARPWVGPVPAWALTMESTVTVDVTAPNAPVTWGLVGPGLWWAWWVAPRVEVDTDAGLE